ncbi:hypothetical protein GCM10027091_64690 [Streptomyces daliensis]
MPDPLNPWSRRRTLTAGGGLAAAAALPPHPVAPMTGVDTFQGTRLGPRWGWNHNPDTGRFTVGSGLTPRTATVTGDLYMLRDSSAWIGLKRDGGTTRVAMVDGLTMDDNWNTTGTGTERAGAGFATATPSSAMPPGRWEAASGWHGSS